MERRIYVACLAAYNNGKLHGDWIDATLGVDHIWDEVNKMLKSSPEESAEEYAIHDYEGFGSYTLSEWSGFDFVAKLADAIEKHGEIFADFLSNEGIKDIDEAVEAFEEKYCGRYESMEDYAEQFVRDCGMLANIPESLQYYFDFERYGRDMELSGDIYTIAKSYKEVHVFYNY